MYAVLLAAALSAPGQYPGGYYGGYPGGYGFAPTFASPSSNFDFEFRRRLLRARIQVRFYSQPNGYTYGASPFGAPRPFSSAGVAGAGLYGGNGYSGYSNGNGGGYMPYANGNGYGGVPYSNGNGCNGSRRPPPQVYESRGYYP